MTQVLAPIARDGDRDAARVRAPSWGVALVLIVAGGLAVRLCYTFVVRADFFAWSDSLYYFWQGQNLAEGRGYIDPFAFGFQGHVAESAYHPPLYGTILGVASWLGASTRDGARLVSCFLGTGTVVVIAFVARRVRSPRAGLVAAAFAAVYPALWVNDALLMSETMAALMVAVTLLAAYRFRASPSLVAAALLGAAVGLATLARSETVLLFLLVAVPFTLAPQCGSVRQRTRLLATATLAVLVVIGPWVGYNLVRFERPELLTTGTGPTLAAGACDETFSGRYLGYFASCPQTWPKGDESVVDAGLRHDALRYWRAHVTHLPVVIAARVGRVWGVFRPRQSASFDATGEARGSTGARLALAGYYLAIPFAIGGLVALRRRGVSILPFVSLAIVVTLAAAGTFGVQRYRVPADVGIVVAAGVGVDALVRRWSRRRAGFSA